MILCPSVCEFKSPPLGKTFLTVTTRGSSCSTPNCRLKASPRCSEVTTNERAPLIIEFSTRSAVATIRSVRPKLSNFSRIDFLSKPAFHLSDWARRSGHASRRSITYGIPNFFAARYATKAVGSAGTVPTTKSGVQLPIGPLRL